MTIEEIEREREEIERQIATVSYARIQGSTVNHRVRQKEKTVTWCGLKIDLSWIEFAAIKFSGQRCKNCRNISELRSQGVELDERWEELDFLERYEHSIIPCVDILHSYFYSA